MNRIESLKRSGYSERQIVELMLREAEDMRRRKADEEAEAERLRLEAEERLRLRSVPVTMPEATVSTGPRVHFRTPLLRAAIKAGVDSTALVGPAGTGKTTAARLIAEELGRAFEAVSFGPTTPESRLFGFMSPRLQGAAEYVTTSLVRMARAGGVFLCDELDAAHAGIVVGMNMAVANPCFGTPEGMVTKHPDFRVVFGMNTFGTGADRQYVGRTQLDAASLDRMFFVDWPVDWGLVHHINGTPGVPSKPFDLSEGGTCSPFDWTNYCERISEAVEALKVRAVVSPRAALMGPKLFAQGVGRRWVESGLIWKGMDAATKDKVLRHALENN